MDFMDSGKTSVTLDQATAMQLRAVKAEMSAAAGRVVTLPAVIRALVACWIERGDRSQISSDLLDPRPYPAHTPLRRTPDMTFLDRDS